MAENKPNKPESKLPGILNSKFNICKTSIKAFSKKRQQYCQPNRIDSHISHIYIFMYLHISVC